MSVTQDRTLFTVPAGKTALIKGIRLVGLDASSNTLLMAIANSFAPSTLLGRWAVPGFGMVVDADTDPIVMAAGESCYLGIASGGSGAGVCITVSGALLDA